MENPRGVASGVVSVSVDGAIVPDGRVVLDDDGGTHAVQVMLG